jgi:hypothetical protein
MFPLYYRQTSKQNQLCIPQEYLLAVGAKKGTETVFKVRCIKSKKQIILEIP